MDEQQQKQALGLLWAMKQMLDAQGNSEAPLNLFDVHVGGLIWSGRGYNVQEEAAELLEGFVGFDEVAEVEVIR